MVLLNLIQFVLPSAFFCLCRWKVGRNGMINGQTIRTSECKSTKWVTLHVNMLRWVNLAKGAVKVAERRLPHEGLLVGVDGLVDVEGHLVEGGVGLGEEVRVEPLAVVAADALVDGGVHDLEREGLRFAGRQPWG